MASDTHLKEDGKACDIEFQNAGSQLIDLGNKLHQLATPASPTS
jgi:hypothetical protein